jgi:CspA family cold shock protein
MYGIVKWYNIKKGYGFIKTEKGEDIFVHKNHIPFWKIFLNKGERFEFSIEDTNKGPVAVDLKEI